MPHPQEKAHLLDKYSTSLFYANSQEPSALAPNTHGGAYSDGRARPTYVPAVPPRAVEPLVAPRPAANVRNGTSSVRDRIVFSAELSDRGPRRSNPSPQVGLLRYRNGNAQGPEYPAEMRNTLDALFGSQSPV